MMGVYSKNDSRAAQESPTAPHRLPGTLPAGNHQTDSRPLQGLGVDLLSCLGRCGDQALPRARFQATPGPPTALKASASDP